MLTVFCQLGRMRKATILLLLAALAVPARAAGEKPADAKKGGQPGTNLDKFHLMAPLSDADGKLTGYAYITWRATVLADTYKEAVLEKIPYIQDKMVRDVNATAVTSAADPAKVDVPALEKRLMGDAAQVMGTGKIKTILVCEVQIGDLHPKQTPAMNTPADQMAPAVAAPKTAAKSPCDS